MHSIKKRVKKKRVTNMTPLTSYTLGTTPDLNPVKADLEFFIVRRYLDMKKRFKFGQVRLTYGVVYGVK